MIAHDLQIDDILLGNLCRVHLVPAICTYQMAIILIHPAIITDLSARHSQSICVADLLRHRGQTQSLNTIDTALLIRHIYDLSDTQGSKAYHIAVCIRHLIHTGQFKEDLLVCIAAVDRNTHVLRIHCCNDTRS